MIPKKFVKKYGEGLPKVICLKTPNGVKWKLNLERICRTSLTSSWPSWAFQIWKNFLFWGTYLW